MAYLLSVLIPARSEFFHNVDYLGLTVENVLANSTDATEVIVVADGAWPLRPLASHPRLTLIHHSKSIGQRAACNEAARLSTAKYVMKLDAHCAMDKDFDQKLIAEMQPGMTMVPAQYRLYAFDWKCKRCSAREEYGPRPVKCKQCGSKYFKQVVIWYPRDGSSLCGQCNAIHARPTLCCGKTTDRYLGRGRSEAWRFDSTLHFQYGGNYSKTPEFQQTEVADVMSLLGACWMLERERYWELGGNDEAHGSWGQQGVEIACKTWLSGGRLVVNKKTWFAHLFRTRPGFGFPYPNPYQERAREYSRNLWLNNKWPKQIYPLSWLVEKFKPLEDWHTEGNKVLEQVNAAGEEFYGRQPTPPSVEKVTKAAIYYTCNSHDEALELAARANLKSATNGHEIGCVSLKQTDFGDWNVVVIREKSPATMHYQIVEGLQRSTADHVFLCESDVLYSPSHFDFTPPDPSVIYYNTNVWRIRFRDGHAVRTADCKQVSGICAARKLLLAHYRKRIQLIERSGGIFPYKQIAYEPGTRGKFGDEKIATWESPFPNLDITDHGQTLTKPKFSVDEFRNKRYAAGWQETDDALPGWPKLSDGGLQRLLEKLNGKPINIQSAG